MTNLLPPDVVIRLQQEMSLILMEMNLPLETEVDPVLRNDEVFFLLSDSEAVWLGADGSAFHYKDENGKHMISIYRRGEVIDRHEASLPPR